jgi:hypothetical protein
MMATPPAQSMTIMMAAVVVDDMVMMSATMISYCDGDDDDDCLVWRTMHCPTTMLLFASAKEYLQRNSITEGTAAEKKIEK